MRSLASRICSIIALALFCCVAPAMADDLPRMRIGQAISVHGALNWPVFADQPAPRYAWPPFTGARYALTPEKLRKLKATGFDTLRLTVGLGVFLSAAPEQAAELDAIVMDRVGAILRADLNVIVDFHPVTQDARFPPDAFTGKPGEPLVEAFTALLVRTARNLARLPQDRVALELLNEPAAKDYSRASMLGWQETQKSYFDAVRAAAPDLTLVLTGCCACCGRDLLGMDAALFPDPNTYFTFHFYSPHGFTHQQIVDARRPFGPEAFLGSVPYPLGAEQLEIIEQRARAGFAATTIPDVMTRIRARRDLETALSRLKEHGQPSGVAAEFDKQVEWARRAGVSPRRLFLGEFGVQRPGVDEASRARWLAIVVAEARARDIPWAYWSLEGPQYMGLSSDERGTFDPLVLRALGLREAP